MADGKKQIKFIVLPLIASLLLGQNLAFALQPYIASYPDLSKTAVQEIWQRNNFAGTTPGQLSSTVMSVVSSAEQQSNGAITGWQTQQFNAIDYSSNIKGIAQIWKPCQGTAYYDCQAVPNCPTLGTFSQINYVIQDMYWSSDGSSITFYWNAIYNDLSQHAYTVTYTKGGDDPNRYFTVGKETIAGNQIKYVQVGVESISSTNAWQIKQWGGGYKAPGGADTYFSSYSDYSIEAGGGTTNGSQITYTNDGGGGYTIYSVGQTYYSANADYPNKPGSSLQPGEVVWYYYLTRLIAGTKLWG
ncbi:MAG: hypothetical protein HYY22_09400 [Thaumarchaeota archaeon]|nr:hypothetical protein [Nitrososphaerota archaeon]